VVDGGGDVAEVDACDKDDEGGAVFEPGCMPRGKGALVSDGHGNLGA
jgi:hypothetical protein